MMMKLQLQPICCRPPVLQAESFARLSTVLPVSREFTGIAVAGALERERRGGSKKTKPKWFPCFGLPARLLDDHEEPTLVTSLLKGCSNNCLKRMAAKAEAEAEAEAKAKANGKTAPTDQWKLMSDQIANTKDYYEVSHSIAPIVVVSVNFAAIGVGCGVRDEKRLQPNPKAKELSQRTPTAKGHQLTRTGMSCVPCCCSLSRWNP